MMLFAVSAPLVTAAVLAALLGTANALEQKLLTHHPAEAEHRRR